MTVRHGLRNQERVRGRSFLLRLAVLAVFFSVGVLLGQALSGDFRAGAVPELSRYLRSFFTLSEDRTLSAKTVLSAVLIYFRYPLLAFLMGFASVGIVLLPGLTAAFGFFLSFSICCFTAAFGGDGMLLALSVFGLRCLVTLPCYFLLAVPSLQNAFCLTAGSFGRGKRCQMPRYGADWWLRLGIVSLVLCAGTAAELLAVPHILHFAMTRIFT